MRDLDSVLVTGATGFLGGHLVRKLAELGHDVHVVTRRGADLSGLGPIQDRLVVHETDGKTESVIQSFESARPDVVFHLASFFQAEHSTADVERLIDSNVKFSTQILEGMTCAGTNRLVNVGTSWEHFNDAEYDPVCLYAATKHATEAIVEYYCRANGMRCITLKLFDTYGEGDHRKKLFHLFAQAAKSAKPLLFSEGKQLIDIVYVDDVVDAFLLAAGITAVIDPSIHQRYGISSGNPIALKELALEYEKALGSSLNIKWGGRPYRNREVMRPWTRYEALPGWKPKVTLAEGLAVVAREAERRGD